MAISKKCRLIITVPVYDERPETVLPLLNSLKQQEGAGPEQFAVVFNVNNSKKEALAKSGAFLTNQNFLNYFRDFKSSLQISLLDNSPVDKAPEINNVGVARQRLGREAARRFAASGMGDKGIIAMTDCDCQVSPNFAAEIITTFDKYPELNGLSGQLLITAPAGMPYAALVVEAVRLHMEKYKPGPAGDEILEDGPEPKKIFFHKADRLSDVSLSNGQNMAVTAAAFLLAGGIPPLDSSEDHAFGRNLQSLAGDVAKNYNYWVKAELRPSERTGFGSLGRRVKVIAESVEDFMRGRSQKILVPDLAAAQEFYKEVSGLEAAGGLSGSALMEIMARRGFGNHGLTEKQLHEWAEILHQENKGQLPPGHSELWLLQNLHGHFPKKDITKDIEKWADGLLG